MLDTRSTQKDPFSRTWITDGKAGAQVVEKLIVCSVLSDDVAIVQSWTLQALRANLRQQRRRWREPFLPVAAFTADDDAVRKLLHASGYPVELTVSVAAKMFGRAPLDAAARALIVNHIGSLEPARAGVLYGVWERAISGLYTPVKKS